MVLSLMKTCCRLSAKNLLTPWSLKDGPGSHPPAWMAYISRDSTQSLPEFLSDGKALCDVRPTSLAEDSVLPRCLAGGKAKLLKIQYLVLVKNVFCVLETLKQIIFFSFLRGGVSR